jgi:hypothetical protein
MSLQARYAVKIRQLAGLSWRAPSQARVFTFVNLPKTALFSLFSTIYAQNCPYREVMFDAYNNFAGGR